MIGEAAEMVRLNNSDELALIAEEIGAEVVRGTVCYPGREGGFDVGDFEIEEFLYELKDQKVVFIIAPLGPSEKPPVICGLWGTPYDGDECPLCKSEREDAKALIERRLRQNREEKDRLIREVEESLKSLRRQIWQPVPKERDGMLEQIEDLVRDILRGYAEPWPAEITDRVFLAIEGDQARAQVYWNVVRELDHQGKRGQQIVNQYIGKRVKLLTTGLNRGRSYSPRSSLIQSYEKH